MVRTTTTALLVALVLGCGSSGGGGDAGTDPTADLLLPDPGPDGTATDATPGDGAATDVGPDGTGETSADVPPTVPGLHVVDLPATAPASLPLAVTVEAIGTDGKPATGATITARVSRGGGTLSQAAAQADSAGRATFAWTLGAAPVRQRLDLSWEGLAADATLEATVATPGQPQPFADVNAYLAAQGIAGSTEDLAFSPDGTRMTLGVPGGLVEVDPQGNATTRALTGDALVWALGLAYAADGTLWAADATGKALRRVSPDGIVTTLAGAAGQVPLAYPNDLALTPDGHVVLADTCLGQVLVFDGDGTVVSSATFDKGKEGGPNGVAVDPKGDALWVTTENTGLLCTDGTDLLSRNGGLFRFALAPGGKLGARTDVAPGAGNYADGVTFDAEGNLYVMVDTMPEGEIGLAASTVLVRPAEGGDLRPFLSTTDRVMANAAFGTGAFGRTTMYLSLVAMPVVVSPEARGVTKVDVGIPGQPLVPPAPVFEKGLVAPLDAIPCTDQAGQPTSACNHHGSSVAVQPDGTVVAAWYTGAGEYSKDSRIVWSRRAPGGDFGPWEVLFDEPDIPEGNPVIAIGDGPRDLWMFFVTVLGTSWNDGIIRMIRSTDGGGTWSAPVTLREQKNWMTRNHPVRLSNGQWLLPCYNETLFVPTWIVSPDGFTQSWQALDLPEESMVLHIGEIQPSVVERADGSLMALMRNGNGPFPGHALEMTSTDFGRTWSDVTPSPLPNPGGSLEMTRLRNGVVAAVLDNSPTSRRPEAVALSDDEGRTWSAVANLVDACEGGDCGYPSLAEDPTDGSIWVTYTHARRTIGWVHVNEAWIRAKGDALATIP